MSLKIQKRVAIISIAIAPILLVMGASYDGPGRDYILSSLYAYATLSVVFGLYFIARNGNINNAILPTIMNGLLLFALWAGNNAIGCSNDFGCLFWYLAIIGVLMTLIYTSMLVMLIRIRPERK